MQKAWGREKKRELGRRWGGGEIERKGRKKGEKRLEMEELRERAVTCRLASHHPMKFEPEIEKSSEEEKQFS